MIYLILFLSSFSAFADSCFLTQEKTQTGAYNVWCGVGAPVFPVICPVSESKDGSLYRIEITDSEGAVLRSWDKSEVLAENEKILCTLDPVKVILKEAEEKAKADAEKAKEDKKAADWQTACEGAKAGSVEALICIERGY